MDLINASFISASIRTDIKSRELWKEFSIIHLYGRYDDRKFFWERFKETDRINEDNVILGGDDDNESWGNLGERSQKRFLHWIFCPMV